MSYSDSRYNSRRYLPLQRKPISIPYPNEAETTEVRESEARSSTAPGNTVHNNSNSNKIGSRNIDRKDPFGLSSIGSGLNSVFDFFKTRITIEEIILIGVLIILLEEENKDEILLIMLAYILLF